MRGWGWAAEVLQTGTLVRTDGARSSGAWVVLHALEAARSHAGEKDRCIPHEARTARTLGWAAMPSGCGSECGFGGGGPGSLVDLPRWLPARRASLP